MRIICVHQGSELYGSDRSFLQVIKYLINTKKFTTITVVLPRTGPLVQKLESLMVDIRIIELSLISKTYLKKLQFSKIIVPLFGLRRKYKLFSSYDVVYINTSVIIDLYLIAPMLKTKKVLHVREIPTPPLNRVLSFLMSKSKASIIFNSNSTRNAFRPLKNSFVIHNAFEGFANYDAIDINSESTELKLLLIGRINNWKGQDFAIDAIKLLRYNNVKLRIVGSPFEGNESLLENLIDKVKSLHLENKIQFVPFILNPANQYAWADVIIVPSTKPEPFGRIAIEAMSMGKPVIAADHGGLSEIVEHNYTGFLFQPSSLSEFVRFVAIYSSNRKLLKYHSANARKVFKKKFSIQIMYKKLEGVFSKS